MVLLTLIFVSSYLFTKVLSVNPDIMLNTEQMIRKHGYSVELHEVVTRDGYISNLYRIPRGLNGTEVKNKSAVLFVHGQGGSPQNFIILGKEIAPAYYFADRGFDVWLFCARGVECQNPTKHVKYDWNKHQNFWNFSFHEIGLYDVSASVDVVLKKTGQQKIFLVGHSVGELSIHALLSEKPKYNAKIKINAVWAPQLILKETDYPFFQILCELSHLFKNIYKSMEMQEAIPLYVNELLSDTLRKMCAHPKWFKSCKAILWCFGSRISYLMEDNVVEFALNNVPRLSAKQLTHYMDHVKKGDFRKYDYGSKLNMAIYGQKLSPLYKLSLCTAPTALFWGATDSFSMTEDMETTRSLLPNVIFDHKIGPKYVHLDFVLAENSTKLLYEPNVKLFKDYDNKKIKN